MKFLLLMTFIFPFSHSVYPPPFSSGEGVEPPTKFSKRGGGLTGPQLLERHDSFRGGGGAVLHKRLTKILNN